MMSAKLGHLHVKWMGVKKNIRCQRILQKVRLLNQYSKKEQKSTIGKRAVLSQTKRPWL